MAEQFVNPEPGTASQDPLCGTQIGDFRILDRVGEGGSGVVYRAVQLRVSREAAIKILHPELQRDESSIRSFLREVRMASRIEHPNIIQSYDAGRTPDGSLFLAMEYVKGKTLEDIRLDGSMELTLRRVCEIAMTLADALNYAWKHYKLIHGDIKPGNVMLREADGMVKLADLGLARAYDESDEKGEGGIFATPLYASPEVILNVSGNIGPASDIYSFGAMMYELLCGTAPFDGDMDQVLHSHLSDTPIALAARCDWIPSSLSYFIDRCLRKKIEERPRDWEEVRLFFKNLIFELDEEEKKISRIDGTRAPSGRRSGGLGGFLNRYRNWIIIAIAGALTLAMLTLIFFCILQLT